MYNVLLADDEGIVIDSLKFIIEKEFGNKCNIMSAKTGRSVIEMAESFHPDVAVMDIQMPGINGIEAMREIRKSNQSIKFIVMSAYDKFDYAQEALKLGAIDYVTKPMNRNVMLTVLKKAFSMVDSDRERRSRDLIIREKLETVIPIIESGFIYSVIFKEHFSEDVQSYKSLLEITEDKGYMMAIVCGDEQEGNHMTNAVGSGVKLQKKYHEICECIKENFRCVIGTIMSNKIAVFVPTDNVGKDYETRVSQIEKARQILHKLKKTVDTGFRIGIGRVKDFGDMSDSYAEALNALLASKGSVVHAGDLSVGLSYVDNYPGEIEKKLFEEMNRGRVEEAVAAAVRFFEWMRNKDLMDVRLKCLEFVIRAETIAYDKGCKTYRFESRNDYLPTIMRTSDKDELKEWFLVRLTETATIIKNRQIERSMSVVERAKRYIEDNYSKNISLDDVSREVDISSYYFSRMFKEETGVNFIDYLTDIRIEKAKELLTNSDYSMKELCQMVGYTDPNYFSRSFKKKTGVTPSEYKEVR